MNDSAPFDTQDSSNFVRRDSSNIARRDTGSELARRDTDSSELARRDSANVARRNTSESQDFRNNMEIYGKNNVQVDSSKLIFKKVRENDTYLKLRRKTQHVGQMNSRVMKKMTDDSRNQM